MTDSYLDELYLTPERKMLRDLAREFAMEEVLPLANELDSTGGMIPQELITKMADIGFFGILIPEEYGGLGLGAVEYCLVAEELARAWMSVASIIARGNGLSAGFDEQRRREILPKMARGEYLGAFALSEPDVGSDVAGITCRAALKGDEWIVNGAKMWCTFADGADFIILFARTDPPADAARRHSGISAFFVTKERGGFPAGISGEAVRKIGYHGWNTWSLSFDDFALPRDALLGERGNAFATAMGNLQVARCHTAARAVGLAQGALSDSIKYAAQRIQFNRPIGEFQAIRFKIADMATSIAAARQLLYSAAAAVDAGGRRTDIETSMCKLFASEMAERVTSEAIQIHGGAGYTTDFAVERHWRDARLTKIFEGTSEIQKVIISDRLLGRAAR